MRERDVSRIPLEAIPMETGKQHDNGIYNYISRRGKLLRTHLA